MKSLPLLLLLLLFVYGSSAVHHPQHEFTKHQSPTDVLFKRFFCTQTVSLYEQVCKKEFVDDEKHSLSSTLKHLCCREVGCTTDEVSKFCEWN